MPMDFVCPSPFEPNAFVLSDTQTQTIDSMFEQYLSNMETQTLPFPEFRFMDNQTQTVAGQSVETQTALHSIGQAACNVDSTDMQTQTLFPYLNHDLAELEKIMSEFK